MNELILADSPGEYSVRVDDSGGEIIVDAVAAKTRITINLSSGSLTIESPGDIAVVSGGKLTLKGSEGVDIESGADIRMIASEEAIIRGKMVRIN